MKLSTLMRRILVAMCLVALLAPSAKGATQNVATVRPVPTEIELNPDGHARMEIRAENVSELYGFQMVIEFDASVLSVRDAVPHETGVQIEPGDFVAPDWILENVVDIEEGVMRIAICSRAPNEPVSGGGILAAVVWEGKSRGTSRVALSDVVLTTDKGDSLPVKTRMGKVTVQAAESSGRIATPTLEAAEWTAPAPTVTPNSVEATEQPSATASPATSTSVPPAVSDEVPSEERTPSLPTKRSTADASTMSDGTGSGRPERRKLAQERKWSSTDTVRPKTVEMSAARDAVARERPMSNASEFDGSGEGGGDQETMPGEGRQGVSGAIRSLLVIGAAILGLTGAALIGAGVTRLADRSRSRQGKET